MSTQDKLERVLRDIHVLISRSELYDNTGACHVNHQLRPEAEEEENV